MDLQTQANQQIQLRNLHAKNQQLLKKRADAIIKKLDSISSSAGEVYLLDNVHLMSAVQYISHQAAKKQNNRTDHFMERQIDRQLQYEAEEQDQYLTSQISRLNQQIQNLNAKKQQYIQAQQITSKQILQYDQIIAHNLFILGQRKSFPTQIDTADHFAYDISPDSTITFNKSYVDLLQHYFKRIEQNEAIIQKLESVYKENIVKSQRKNFQISQLKHKSREYEETALKTEKIEQKNNHLRQLLRTQARTAENQIQRRLALEIDKNNKDISNKKLGYQKAYHSLIDLMKRVIDHANIETVTDYIKQS